MGDAPPVLEEHVPRGQPVPPALHGGSAFSEWTALDVLGHDMPSPQLVFAAGARGLMVLPAGFDHTTGATLVDVGGHCLDVVIRGDALVALVGDPPPDPYAAAPAAPPSAHPSRVVLLRAGTGALRVVGQHQLDAPYTRFVR